MATRARHFEAALAGFRDNSGDSLSGGKLQFYVPGTATAKNAFTDRDKTEAVTEVTLDSNGRAEVFGDGWYDIKLLDASGSTLATFEYVYLQRSAFTVETKTADFTASTDVDVYLVDTTNGNVTVSYPTAENIEYPIEIAKKTADANTVTIDPYGSETINGAATFVLSNQNQSAMVASDGANLYTLGAFVNTAVLATNAEQLGGTPSAQVYMTGEVRMYAAASAPTGWLSCDGAEISRTTYAALFAVIGETYGVGDGRTTFALPDFRGRAPIGIGTGSGLTARAIGDETGTETHQLTIDEMPAHNHDILGGDSTGGGQNMRVTNSATTYTTNIQSKGGGQAHNNMQPSLAVNFIIKT
jgi:microcystin-dependent protein